jgi:broad specificity phosphatase PhoE
LPTNLKEAFTGAFEGLVPAEQRFLGGESVGELMDRVHPAIDRLRADTPGTRCCWCCTAASTARSCRSP